MKVKIWGPSDLNFLVGAMKSFIPHAAMVHTQSFGPASTSDDAADMPTPSKVADPIVLVEDEVVKISAILLQPHCSGQSQIKPGEMSVIYVCELPELMGKFDPKKAAALGLKAGPKYGELQHGKSVKSDSLDIMVGDLQSRKIFMAPLCIGCISYLSGDYTFQPIIFLP